jgi:hypothetical protein
MLALCALAYWSMLPLAAAYLERHQERLAERLA